MKLIKQMKLPKEHGAWAMFYVPFVLGLVVAGKLNWAVLCLFVSLSAIFISRESLLVWWRAKKRDKDNQEARNLLVIYAALALLTGLPLLLVWKFYWLLPLGMLGGALLVFNGAQGSQLSERALLSELLAILGLTMSAPAAYSVAIGAWTVTALWLWVLSAVYFSSSVFYIKHSMASVHGKSAEAKSKQRVLCLSYHAFLLAGLVALILLKSLSAFALIAFLPIIARAFWSVLRPPTTISLKRIGFTELGFAIFYLIVLGTAF